MTVTSHFSYWKADCSRKWKKFRYIKRTSIAFDQSQILHYLNQTLLKALQLVKSPISIWCQIISIDPKLQPAFQQSDNTETASHGYIMILSGRYKLNKLTSLPTCGFTAQLVEHRTGIVEVTGPNPVEALIFSGFFLPIALIGKWPLFTLILSKPPTTKATSFKFC